MTDIVAYHFQFIAKVKTLNQLSTIQLHLFFSVWWACRSTDFHSKFSFKIALNSL